MRAERDKLLVRLLVGSLTLSVGYLVPVALAGAGSSATTSSTGTWISSTPAGSSSPEDFTLLATGSVANDSSIATESDSTPVSAFDASGHGVVAWENRDGGYVEASFIEPGHTWSRPELVGTGTNPVVAVDSAGDAVVVFTDTASGSGSVAYAYSAAGSDTFNATVEIDGLAGEQNPQVVIDSSDDAWVTWYTGGSVDTYRYAELTAGQLAGGANSSSSPSVSVKTLGAGGDTSFRGRAVLAADPAGGGVVAAWTAFPAAERLASASRQIDVAYAAPGAETFGPVTALPDPSGDSNSPAVAVNSSGEAVVAWDGCSQPDGSRFCDGSGRAIEVASAGPTQLSMSNGPTFSPAQSLAPAGQGGDIGADGLDQDGEFNPAVAVNGSQVAVAWSDSQPSSAVVDGAIEPLSDLDDDTPGWTELSGIPASDSADGAGTPHGGGPQIAIDANSDVILAWDDGNALNVARAADCTAGCQPLTVTQLDTDAAGGGQYPAEYEPSLAADAGGDLLLSWLSDHDSSISPATVAATYDAGPLQTSPQIPATATTGTPVNFSVESSDIWSGLAGPVTTTWNFGDGSSETGVTAGHTYTTTGTYTVSVVSHATDGASSTTSRQIVVSAAAVSPTPTSTPVSTPTPAPAQSSTRTGATWGSGSAARSVAADLTVPALVCPSSGAARGQELGVELSGGLNRSATGSADFAGVEVLCRGGTASYRPSFTVVTVGSGKARTETASRAVSPGDLLSLKIAGTARGESLTVTDLSQPSERSVSLTGALLVTHTGWQVGAFPIAGVSGPVQTLATGFTDVSAGGAGISRIRRLVSSAWGPARVSRIGAAENQFSVLYRATPQPKLGDGDNAIAATGGVEFRRPGTRRWVRLKSPARLPNGTVINASSGTVQLTATESHGQTQSVTAWGGEFRIANQHDGAIVLDVIGTWSASEGASPGRSSRLKRKRTKKTVTGNLWTKGHGKVTTKGSYGSASVLGSEWLTRNLKSGTLFRVTRNRLDTKDVITVTVYYPKRHTVKLRQGQSLVAPAPHKVTAHRKRHAVTVRPGHSRRLRLRILRRSPQPS